MSVALVLVLICIIFLMGQRKNIYVSPKSLKNQKHKLGNGFYIHMDNTPYSKNIFEIQIKLAQTYFRPASFLFFLVCRLR